MNDGRSAGAVAQVAREGAAALKALDAATCCSRCRRSKQPTDFRGWCAGINRRGRSPRSRSCASRVSARQPPGSARPSSRTIPTSRPGAVSVEPDRPNPSGAQWRERTVVDEHRNSVNSKRGKRKKRCSKKSSPEQKGKTYRASSRIHSVAPGCMAMKATSVRDRPSVAMPPSSKRTQKRIRATFPTTHDASIRSSMEKANTPRREPPAARELTADDIMRRVSTGRRCNGPRRNPSASLRVRDGVTSHHFWLEPIVDGWAAKIALNRWSMMSATADIFVRRDGRVLGNLA